MRAQILGGALLAVWISTARAETDAGVPSIDTTGAIELPPILSAFDEMGRAHLWPGFAPLTTPIAIFDGKHTWLVRFPKQPKGFVPSKEIPGAYVINGRHSAIRANTAVAIEGVTTATVDFQHASHKFPRNAAALMVHECFHVFARTRHPDWTANEAVAFSYPVDDAELLTQRRLESAELQRALVAAKPAERNGWIRAALDTRAARFAKMDPAAVAYERGTELNEGLATYVENEALGGKEPVVLDTPPEEFRKRAYGSGRALAVLLDRVKPDWKKKFGTEQGRSLDEELSSALEKAKVALEAIAPDTRAELEKSSQTDVEDLKTKRTTVRQAFLAVPGWQLVVDAVKAPLFPEQFDPLNLLRVGAGEVLHRRWLKLANSETRIEMLNRASLTQDAGDRPLLDGVKQLTVAGLEHEPKVVDKSGSLSISGDGLTAQFSNAKLVRDGQTLRVLLGVPK